MKDYFRYRGKVCVVTGAASGMGRAVCEMLLDLEAEVYALDVAEVTLPVKKALCVNIGDKASVDKAWKELPERIDCFFGIAGVSGVKTDFKTTCMINFTGHKYMTEQYVIPAMESGGAIAFMGSRGGKCWRPTIEEYRDVVESPDWESCEKAMDEKNALVQNMGYGEKSGLRGYYYSKRMMNFYVKYLTKPLMEKGIRINIINPGTTQTQLTAQWESIMTRQQMLGVNRSRLAEPEEMAMPIVFANSYMANFMTGIDISVDNGQQGTEDYLTPFLEADFITHK